MQQDIEYHFHPQPVRFLNYRADALAGAVLDIGGGPGRYALELARARAEMYAKSLGMRVRRIVSISEGGGLQPPVPMMKAMAMDARMESAPVAPGETTLSASLDVVFELGN